jgi:2',3'-cyclic-nucleotide 2'-phosphodiesterase (5'-nucleotidase family)
MGNFARLASVIRQEEQAVKIDLGDFSQGDYAVTAADALPMIRAFNLLGYEILVPGNHEIEYREEVLLSWQKNFRGEILGAQWSLGSFRMPSYRIIERAGIRVGVVALGESGLKKRHGVWSKLQYRDEIEILRKAVADLQKNGCAAIVLACHISSLNYGVLGRILREVPEIDVVAGAHSHKEIPGGMLGSRFAVQPGAGGSSAVKLVLHFDRDGKYRFASSSLLEPGSETDAEIRELAVSLEKQRNIAERRVIGRFANSAAFGKYCAEILRRTAGADAGLFVFPANKFRNPLTEAGLFDILPYGNRIATVDISRHDAEKLLKNCRKKRFCSTAGDWSKEYFTLAVTDFIYFSYLSGKKLPVEIHEFFERQTIAESLKKTE